MPPGVHAMRGIVVAVVLISLSLGAFEAVAAGTTGGPRVVLGVDTRTGQRYLQLSDRGPVFPTADVTCDGNRRTVALTRSGTPGNSTVATYAVPPKVSAVMLQSAECRLMLPGREIAVPRQQIRSAWSGHTAQKH